VHVIDRSERGASALFVTSAIVLLFGMAAIAVDVGSAFTERRQNQSAADVASLAGILDFSAGAPAMRDQVLSYVESNLTIEYSPSEWEALWTTCTDPNKNQGGLFNFQPVPSPWTAGSLDCISVDASGYLRVRVPDQLQSTTFGFVVGMSELSTHAAAIAQLTPTGGGDLLPFAAFSDSGTHLCFKTASGGGPGGGSPPDPCEGPTTGHFGEIDSPLFGNPDLGTPSLGVCPAGAFGDKKIIATNIALGLDHPIFANASYPSGEIRDQCFNVGVNALNVKEGGGNSGQGVEPGLISGSGTGPSGDFYSPLAGPRLQRGPYANRSVKGVNLDDKPLWDFLVPHNATPTDGDTVVRYGTNAPESCRPSNVGSWADLETCLTDYAAGSGFVQIFEPTIATTPRFAYVPRFYGTKDDLPAGNSPLWMNIEEFVAIYIQGLWFGSGANLEDFHPGEGYGESYPANQNLVQISALAIPDDALPMALRANPSPNIGSLYDSILYR
jgi:hypothetical protein